VLNWADFLHGGKYVGELCYFTHSRSGWLRVGLLVLNLTVAAVSLVATSIAVKNPNLAHGENHRSNGVAVPSLPTPNPATIERSNCPQLIHETDQPQPE